MVEDIDIFNNEELQNRLKRIRKIEEVKNDNLAKKNEIEGKYNAMSIPAAHRAFLAGMMKGKKS